MKLQSLLVLYQQLRGLLFLALEPGLAAWCGTETPCSSEGNSTGEISLPIFIHHMWAWEQPFYVSAPPTSLEVASSLYP